MVKEVVTAAESDNDSGPRFNLTPTEASSFTLEEGAFLGSTNDNTVILGGAAAWSIVINGQIIGGAGEYDALWLNGTGASKITVGENGSLRAFGSYGAGYFQADTGLTNHGNIIGTNVGLQFMGGGKNSLVNTGLLGAGSNAAEFGGSSADTVINSGKIVGKLQFGDGTNKLVNSGLITNATNSPEFSDFGAATSDIFFGSGNDTIDNKGRIDGYVNLGNGINSAKNSGQIFGYFNDSVTYFNTGVLGGADGDTFTNDKAGAIAYAVDLGGGANSFTNAGYVGQDENSDSYVGGSGIDTVKNSGFLKGNVDLLEGNDVFTNTGQVLGKIDLGDGNDVFKGGNFAETVKDGVGMDKIALGGGDDRFLAFGDTGDGDDGVLAPDEIDGGTGTDTYDGSAVPAMDIFGNLHGILVNLDSVDHNAINKGSATDADENFTDNLKGFENVTGGAAIDVIFGSSGSNVIKGGGGDDELFGLGGNDVIDGEGGIDTITGGLGADILKGGSDGDTFVYESLKDSGVTKATRDEIFDFDEFDSIDLNAIDAIAATAAVNDNFIELLLGADAKFTAGDAGRLRAYQTATGWMIEGEVTGDGKADFSIAVRDLDHSFVWALNSDELYYGGP